ncbi:MAG: UDP-N-acetylglucosamine 2-epimerase [Xanthomonadales bacterium]|nr:UDP-N-acetylglucosamine 2-epimerase [Xanthomonadales bacterium]
MANPRVIAVVSSSRADYSHLFWCLKAIEAHPELSLRLVLFGAHLAPEFGATGDEAERDGFEVSARVESQLSSDTDVGMAKSLGLATLGLADVLGEMRPDWLLIIADRYEMLAAGCAATTLRIPVAHIEGGEISRGAIDDAIRNALTKLAHLHLTPHAQAAARVAAMGEEAWRIRIVGAPSLDHLRRSTIPVPAAVREALGLPAADSLIVVALHPLTLSADTLAEVEAVFAALEDAPGFLVFCFPNADAGSRALIGKAHRFCEDHPAKVFVNLPAPQYFGLLGAASLMLGNSSSGIMETPSFRLPTLNIGRRQEGRLCAANVRSIPAETAAIREGMRALLEPEFREALAELQNPYGDGQAADKIAEALAEAPHRDRALDKRWALA